MNKSAGRLEKLDKAIVFEAGKGSYMRYLNKELGCRNIADPICKLLALIFLAISLSAAPAQALQIIPLKADSQKELQQATADAKIELARKGDFYAGKGRSFQVETAPDKLGITQRILVRSSTRSVQPNWVVFALRNDSNQHLERWLVADRYTITGSRVFWPDLDAPRLLSVTPSLGFKPQRLPSDQTDIFKISIEPGQTVTYVAELVPGRFPNLNLWKPQEYEKTRRNLSLFNGILLGVAGLIAIFLTVIFVANSNVVFPVAAMLAWSSLGYLAVDFGFFDKLFQLDAENNALYRAILEATFAASLLVFFFTFLRLRQWHLWVWSFFYCWIALQVGLVIYAFANPILASGLARTSIVIQAVLLTPFVAYLALAQQKRALSLLPTWMHFLVWVFGGAVIIQGLLSGEFVNAGLNAGLVLLVALIGFLVIQFAFHQSDYGDADGPGELKTRALALKGAGAHIWEWNERRDEIKVSQEIEESLGLTWGSLNCRVDEFLGFLHPADRDRLRQSLFEVQEAHGGLINIDFRMRRTDGTYFWFDLDAHSIDQGSGRYVRSVGLIRDVTAERRARERLLHDAVHDSLTGLPNRKLFLDRLDVAVKRSVSEDVHPPTVLLIDIDRFNNVNSSLGLGIGDSLLLTVARRLEQNLQKQDTLARVGGDQFAIQIIAERDPRIIANIAEKIRKLLRQPIEIGAQEVVLTSSIGVSIFDKSQNNFDDLYREAEIAMYRAKRQGTDRIEIFVPEMRQERNEIVALESELRQAVDRDQIKVHFQPILEIGKNQLAGFEALLRWQHPKFGNVTPDKFIPIAEESGSIYELGLYALETACRQYMKWQDLIDRLHSPLFLSVNVSSRQIFQHDLVKDVTRILEKYPELKGVLRLEITESLVMENPEKAVQILDRLKAMGIKLSMDDFGTGYSSFAYLSRFPFDTLKIDREIVQISDKDITAPTILRSVVAMAHELQLDVVAEGVEASEELEFLRQIGCDFAQGYFFGVPMSEDEIAELLETLIRTGRLPLNKSGDMSLKKLIPNRMAKSADNSEKQEAQIPTKATLAQST